MSRCLFILILAWAFFQFARCGSERPRRCSPAYKMPSGAICEVKEGPNFSLCSDGQNYINPPHYEHTEFCK